MSRNLSYFHFTFWIERVGVICYLNNENFNSIKFEWLKNESGTNIFVMNPKKWIKAINEIGIILKQGRYNGGTFEHQDIAFEFASLFSPEFNYRKNINRLSA